MAPLQGNYSEALPAKEEMGWARCGFAGKRSIVDFVIDSRIR